MKFEVVFSDSHLNVLDVTLLYVYSKPTDSHLPPAPAPSSSHPRHVFKTIPFGIALRLRRNCSVWYCKRFFLGVSEYNKKNCSEDNFLSTRCEEYKGFLVNQGYLGNLVDNRPIFEGSNYSKETNTEAKSQGIQKEKKHFQSIVAWFKLHHQKNLQCFWNLILNWKTCLEKISTFHRTADPKS